MRNMSESTPSISGLVTVRPAGRDDIERVSDLLTSAYAEFERDFPWPELWSAYVTDVIDVQGRWGKSLLLVAESDGAVVGSVDYYPPGRGYRLKAELVDALGPENTARATFPTTWGAFRYLATSEAMRGRGIGRMMVERLITLAKSDGASHLVLHTMPTMRAAMRIYDRMAFARLPERDLHVDPGREDKVLAYSLPLG
jgi:ribosomal protein S18 acetylase RimI-like enzyme